VGENRLPFKVPTVDAKATLRPCCSRSDRQYVRLASDKNLLATSPFASTNRLASALMGSDRYSTINMLRTVEDAGRFVDYPVATPGRGPRKHSAPEPRTVYLPEGRKRAISVGGFRPRPSFHPQAAFCATAITERKRCDILT
jgi:hypothetical protein